MAEPVKARGVRLGSFFGINVHLDWSLLIIFALVVVSLGTGYLPSIHSDWSVGTVWITATVAGLLFFVSVLLHEFSHALVGRRVGVPVKGITLFLFGGLAHMEKEPESPAAEWWMTVVGPLTSFALAAGFTLAGTAFAPAEFQQTLQDEPQQAMGLLTPAATLCFWLGSVNFILAVFNLVPGFPLDGGRVLRAGLWAATGDLIRATRWASNVGRFFGFALIACGVLMVFGANVPFFGTGFAPGLWLIVIGWFLSNAARASYEQLVVRDTLSGLAVESLMTTDVHSVSPTTHVEDLVANHLMRISERSVPVVENGELCGIVGVEHVRTIDRDDWSSTPVRSIMQSRDAVETIRADAPAERALNLLGRSSRDQLPVVDGERFIGMIRLRELARWVSLSGQPSAG